MFRGYDSIWSLHGNGEGLGFAELQMRFMHFVIQKQPRHSVGESRLTNLSSGKAAASAAERVVPQVQFTL